MSFEPEYFALSVNYDFMEPIARGKIRGWDMRANYGRAEKGKIEQYAREKVIPARFLPYFERQVYDVSNMFYREAPLSPPIEREEKRAYYDHLGSNIIPLNTDSESTFRAGDFLDAVNLVRLRGWPVFMCQPEFSEFTLWSLLGNPRNCNIGMAETGAAIIKAFEKGLDVDVYRLVGRVESDLLHLARTKGSSSKYRLHFADLASLEYMCKLELEWLSRLPGLSTALRTTTRENPDPIYIPRRDGHHEPHFLGNMLTLTWNVMELVKESEEYANLSIEVFEGLPTFRGTILGDADIIFMAMPAGSPGVLSKGFYATSPEFVSLARDTDIRRLKPRDRLDSPEQTNSFIGLCKEKIEKLVGLCASLEPGLRESTVSMIRNLCLQADVIPTTEKMNMLKRTIFEDCYDLQPLYEGETRHSIRT